MTKKSVPSFVGRLYTDEHIGPGGLAGTWVRHAEVDALLAEIERLDGELEASEELAGAAMADLIALRKASEQNATPGATFAGEDSDGLPAESSRPRGLRAALERLLTAYEGLSHGRACIGDPPDPEAVAAREALGTSHEPLPVGRIQAIAILDRWLAEGDPDGEQVRTLQLLLEGPPQGASRDASFPVHYDPTGKTREPPHCPSCDCPTESGAPRREAGDRAGPLVSRHTEKSE